MSNSFITLVDDASGDVKIILSNFTGELTVKEFIGLKKSVDCPLPPKAPTARNVSRDDGNQPASKKEDEERSLSPDDGNGSATKKEDDETVDLPDDQSRNLLDDSDESDVNKSSSSDASTVYEMAKGVRGLNVSVANDDDLEYDWKLSQQVDYF